MEYLSFGAGPPSLALLILNAWGDITPKAELVMYADTGWEKAITNNLIPEYRDWSEEMGLEFIEVQSKDGPLDQYMIDKGTVPIPVHTEEAMAPRRCTEKWKIRPINRYLRERYGKVPLVAQLGLTWGEAHRMKDPIRKGDSNRCPLIEKRLSRQDCIEIIRMAGLTVPPPSACLGCPFQNQSRWQQLATKWPDDFHKAVAMDHHLRDNALATGNDPIWLHRWRRPLDNIVSTAQLGFPLDDTGELEVCSDSNCFT